MQDHKEIHWNGTVNRIIRYWFYILKGLDVFNQFKYLIGAIFALYWMLKMKNPAILVIMFVVCIPVLFIIGYYSVHYIGRVVDWLNVEFSSYWSRYQFELQERQVKATEDIRDIVSSPINITADKLPVTIEFPVDQTGTPKKRAGNKYHNKVDTTIDSV